jgi:cytochrome c oxidase assembly protein subunit 15
VLASEACDSLQQLAQFARIIVLRRGEGHDYHDDSNIDETAPLLKRREPSAEPRGQPGQIASPWAGPLPHSLVPTSSRRGEHRDCYGRGLGEFHSRPAASRGETALASGESRFAIRVSNQLSNTTDHAAIEIRRDHSLAVGFAALVTLTLGLIVLGALVRAHGAGLACPDWPLCFGDFVPQMDLRIAFEWSHRLVAGSVAVFFSVLSIIALKRTRSQDSIRRLIGIAAGLLAIQILLGALTVWLQLAAWTVTAHLITGNAFALTCLLIAASLRSVSHPPPQPATPAVAVGHGGSSEPWVAPITVRICITASAGLLLLQFVLGGLVSSQYAAMSCPEWPACNGGVYFPTWRGNVGLHLMHRMNGYLLIGSFAVAAWVSRREPDLRRPTALLLGIGLVQVGVGIANVLSGVPVEVTGLHSALAAAIVMTTGLTMRTAWSRGAAPTTG